MNTLTGTKEFFTGIEKLSLKERKQEPVGIPLL